MGITLIPLSKRTRNYPSGANSFLLANAGQKIFQDQFRLLLTFDFTSTQNESVVINSTFSLKASGFTWGDKGFVIGDSIDFSYELDGGSLVVSGTTTITDIQGDELYTANPVATTQSAIGAVVPMNAGPSNSNTPIEIINNTRSLPEQVEIFHNIVNNSSNPNKNSLIDGEQNRFLANDVDAMNPGDAVNMIQMGNKSGGTYTFAELSRTADSSDGRKNFLVLFRYFTPWKIEDSTFDKPSYLTGAQSLKPCYFVKAYPEENNPNAGLAINGYGFNEGNVGWYNESYNGGEDIFELTSLNITDAGGNTINEVDHNQNCTVTGTITGTSPMMDFMELEFYVIPPEEDFQNNEFQHGQNIYLSSFTADTGGVIDSESFTKNSGTVATASQSITSLAGNTLTFSFQLQPNSAFSTYINNLNEQQRLYRISVNVDSSGGTDNENDSVSKILKEGVLTAAPIPDQPFNDLVFSGFYNHWQDIETGVSELNYNGTTEDDMVYKAKFNLEQGVAWERLRLTAEVVENNTGDSFVLEEKNFNFSSFVTDVNGVIQFVGSAATQTIQQYLDSDDRNKIEIFNTGNTSGSLYEVQVNWSLMANWRYWQALSSAFLDFYDPNLPNNGQNNEWVRYLDMSGYSIKLKCRLIRDGVAYFWQNGIILDDYDKSPTITSEIEYEDENGTIQTTLINGQDMLVRGIHTLSSGSWDQPNTEAWISQRGFEEDPNKRISTGWDWTSQSSPLKPKVGETRATITFPSANVAHVECLVDTSQVNVDNVSFIARVEDPSAPTCQHPIDYVFDYIENNASSDSEIVTVYNDLLNNSDATEKNVCCPTCEKTYTDLTGTYTAYVLARSSIVDNYIAAADDGDIPVCCYDSYKVTGTGYTSCDANFDFNISQINSIVTGDTTFIDNTLVPTQMNSYTGTTELVKLKTRLENLTTDTDIRYDLYREIIERGLVMRCLTDGTKILSRG